MKKQFESTRSENTSAGEPIALTNDTLSDLHLVEQQAEQIKGGPFNAFGDFQGGVNVAAGAAQSGSSRHSSGINVLLQDGSVR